MSIRLQFLGAAESVTGSRYLLTVRDTRLLIDAGMYQEREHQDRNWAPFPIPPQRLDAVLLTHAHVDHCGYLPRLVKDGFKGRIFCTAATAEIAKIVLLDSARLQTEDVAFKRKRHQREQRTSPRPLEPLYTVEDVERCVSLFRTVSCGTPEKIASGIEAVFQDAGHILGSTSILVRADNRSVVFSGDIGRWNRPILRDPVPCPAADYVIMESTYGDRLHEEDQPTGDKLAGILMRTRERGGNVIIPSFAIERAQEVLYHLNLLFRAKRIPSFMVFVDSPMAVSVTEVFERHPDLLDSDMNRLVAARQSPFHFQGLKMVQSVQDSKAINSIKGTVVVMAGAGMCTGGRIKHHLAQNITRAESTILFVGYQAEGTLGRLILNGVSPVRLFGQYLPVRAEVAQMPGFSAHGDRNDLLRWLSGTAPFKPRHVFVTHGEPETARGFADTVTREKGFEASAPTYGEDVVLD